MGKGHANNSSSSVVVDEARGSSDEPMGGSHKRSHSDMAENSDMHGSGLSAAMAAAEAAQAAGDAASPPTFRARLSTGTPQSPSAPAESNKGEYHTNGPTAAMSTAGNGGRSNKGNKIGNRWYIGRMTEDGMRFSAELLYPHTNPQFKPASGSVSGSSSSHSNLPSGAVLVDSFGYSSFYKPTTQAKFPLSRITTLGHLSNPLRRASVVEKWSPLEMALFESAMFTHGKKFHDVQRYVKTKTIKEVVAFYYYWKKTAGYKHWKHQYIADVRTHPHMVALGDHDSCTAGAGAEAVAAENGGTSAVPSVGRAVGDATS